MLEDEEENVNQLEILVARFYRPFKMAASSKKFVIFFWFGSFATVYDYYFKMDICRLDLRALTKTSAPSFLTPRQFSSCIKSFTRVSRLEWIIGPHSYSVLINNFIKIIRHYDSFFKNVNQVTCLTFYCRCSIFTKSTWEITISACRSWPSANRTPTSQLYWRVSRSTRLAKDDHSRRFSPIQCTRFDLL